MKQWLLKYTPVFFIALFFYSMISTGHSRALGDIIFETLGIPAWTDGYQGIHLSMFFFFILMVGIFALRDRYVDEELQIRGKKHFYIFISLVVCMYYLHSSITAHVIAQAKGLDSLVLNSDCLYAYRYHEGELTEFQLQFELTNYSDEEREFQLVLEIPGSDERYISFETEYNQNYVLQGKETRLLAVELGKDNVTSVNNSGMTSFGGNGRISSVILKDRDDNRYVIKSMADRGIVMGRD